MDNKKRKRSSSDHSPVSKRLKYDTRISMGILDLPIGPLQLMMSKVNYDKQIMLRQTSCQMKMEHSSYIMHQYKFSVNIIMSLEDGTRLRSVLVNVIRVLDVGTHYFIKAGYENEFTAITMLFPKQLLKAIDTFDVTHMQEFLHQFYNRVETSTESPNGLTGHKGIIQRRVLLTMTLLSLAKQFRGFQVHSSGTNRLFWEVIFEVRGIRFGVSERVPYETDVNKLMDLTIIIAELLVYDLAKLNKTDYIEIGNNSYLFGIKEPTASMRCPKLKFHIRVMNSPAVFKILQGVIDNTLDMSNFNFELPDVNNLSILVETKGSHFNLWNGYDRIHLLIIPF